MLAIITLLYAVGAGAQVTTATMSGKVTAQDEPIIGATIVAIHEPSSTRYGTVTNISGQFNLQGMRTGGPYKVEITYVGYQSAIYKGINLSLGDNYVLNVTLKESSELLDEIVVTASKNSNMKSDRAGAITNIGEEQMASLPAINRSMNDIMRLTPQGSNTGNGFAVGGGNYRQSSVTVDGAAFSNAFGIGSNLPGGGSPISLDALEQIAVSVTPFDVRQSGFIGGAINAVTKSGTNDFYATAYTYLTNENLKGNKVGDLELIREKSQSYLYGASLGGAIIKNKLFFFVNGEYEDNVTAGPKARARQNEGDDWGPNTANINRPTVGKMDEIRNYFIDNYGYNPGQYQGYSIKTPAYKIMARLDWNINDNNKLNFRFTRAHSKDNSGPTSSTSPMYATDIYQGPAVSQGSGNVNNNAALYFENSRYFKEYNFTSYASEWNSKWLEGRLNNVTRVTYSFQDEPRSYGGAADFPTIDILEGGAVYARIGPDIFSPGNLAQAKTFVITDELSYTAGVHNLLAGFQFEHNKATNGFMQAGNGYYIFDSWDSFKSNKQPEAFAITYSNAEDYSQFKAEMKTQQYSLYLQDQMNISENFKLMAGIRFEMPKYPSLKNNYNEDFARCEFGGVKYSTDQVPSAKISVSPRVGFNWDITGERKYVLRGGTGIYVGRLPFVWLVSAVGNSNVGQSQYYYTKNAGALKPYFKPTVSGVLNELYPNGRTTDIKSPKDPTIIDKDLKMPSTWKTSLAFDTKLPGDIDFSLEGIFNKDINPAVISNRAYKPSETTTTFNPNDTRNTYSKYTDDSWTNANGKQNVYYIENGGHKAYYYSITAQLAKSFDFGLNLSAAYTHSKAKSYSDGIGDQVTSAYKTNTYSVNGINEHETGYGTYVSPHRVVASAGYRVEYAKDFASSLSLVYEGMNMGYAGGYGYARYSYTFAGNIVGDGGANNLLYIPGSREELDSWTFATKTYNSTTKQAVDYKLGNDVYTADQQKDDFWAYINQDSYLKKHKGEYVKRGGATMPWHHQLDLKFMQDFYMKVGGKRHTLQLGVDIKNVLNLLNSDWGLYKTVNNTNLLSYYSGSNEECKGYTFQKSSGKKLTDTYTDYKDFRSTYSVMFSVRYIFH